MKIYARYLPLTFPLFVCARSKDSNEIDRKLGDIRNKQLQDILKDLYINRKKEKELEDQLPSKNQRVRFEYF